MSESDQTTLEDGQNTDVSVSPQGQAEADNQIENLTNKMFSPSQSINVLGMGSERIDNITWHDFSEYMHILASVPMKQEEYPFMIFNPSKVNIGLNLVYRQEWRPLGNQRGEIIRTLPLGPKQVERVSTKIVRRSKISKTAESLKSVETTTETSDTVKDSSEIINEAADSFGYQVSAQGGVNVGYAQASVSAGMQGNSENRSKNLCSKLSETMQKTAAKIRSETKTIVSTESESTYEMATASEIQNPNEEIAITYVYSKLQRQYEIFTSLAEIHPVVMIPLVIPPKDKIDYEWVRQYDWILAKVLLDDSFRDALTSISQNPSNLAPIPDLESDLKTGAMRNVLGTFAEASTGKDYSGLLQGSPLLQESQQAYLETVKQKNEREKELQAMKFKWDRFIMHLKDNILHYYQAIWSQYNPQQNMLKLKNLQMKIPMKWKFIGKFGDTEYTGDKFGKTIYDLLSEMIEHQLQSTEPTKNVEEHINEHLALLEKDLIEERAQKINEIELITRQIYNGKIATDTEVQKRLCEQEITDEKDRIIKNAINSSAKLANLKNDFQSISDLCIAIQNTNINYNSTIGLRLPTTIPNTSIEGILLFVNQCSITVASTAVVDLVAAALTAVLSLLSPTEGTVIKARTNYTQILCPAWQKQLNGYSNPDISKSDNLDTIRVKINALISSIETQTIPQQKDAEKKLKVKYDKIIADLTANYNVQCEAEIKAKKTALVEFYEKEIPKRKEWLRKKMLRELKEDIVFQGKFEPFSRSDFTDEELKDMGINPNDFDVDITEIINPAGPIAYYGNYAIYYLKPEIKSSDLMTILTIMKKPYLFYVSRDKEPTLVDPLYKRYLKDYQGMVPSEDERFEMLERVPDLRLEYTLAQQDNETFVPASERELNPIEQLLANDNLFIKYYPEYLFRKELTRRFVVDTNNIILDIERGSGSVLEPFRLAHRGIDVQKAVEERDKLKLENLRMKELLAEKKLDSRYWPDAHKYIALSNDQIQFGLEQKPATEQTAETTETIPVISPFANGDEQAIQATIIGRVETGKSHAPVKHAQVQLTRTDGELDQLTEASKQNIIQVAKTSSSGMFSLVVQQDSYQVLISAAKFEPVAVPADLRGCTAKELIVTLKPLAVKQKYIGNKHTMEFHKPDCPWVAIIKSKNKVQISDKKSAAKKGFDTCGHCLPNKKV